MRVFISLLFLVISPASAQVTTCYGNECTIEENGETRTLTPEEIGKIKRSNARTAIGNIQCDFAEKPEACEEMTRELFKLFPL